MKILNFANVAGKIRGAGVHEVAYSFFKIQNDLNIDSHLWFPGYLNEEKELQSDLKLKNKSKVKALKTYFNPNYGFLKSKSSIKEELLTFDLIHQHGIWLPMSTLSSYAKKITKKPLIIQPHGYLEPYRLDLSLTKKKISYFLFEKKNLELADLLVACSTVEYKNLRILFPNKDIAIIPNGVPESFVNRLSKSNYFKNPKYKGRKNMLFLSRIHQLKGLERLLKVFSTLDIETTKDWNLVIAGLGEKKYIDSLKMLTKSLNLTNKVFFEGPVFNDDKINIMSSADFFILPTYNENYGIVIAESLSRGVPALTTKGAPWNLLNEKYCGVWVDNDVKGIEKGLKKVLSMSNDDLDILKQNCIYVSKEYFLWEKIVPKTIELYKWLLGYSNEKPKFVHLGDKKESNSSIFDKDNF